MENRARIIKEREQRLFLAIIDRVSVKIKESYLSGSIKITVYLDSELNVNRESLISKINSFIMEKGYKILTSKIFIKDAHLTYYYNFSIPKTSKSDDLPPSYEPHIKSQNKQCNIQ